MASEKVLTEQRFSHETPQLKGGLDHNETTHEAAERGHAATDKYLVPFVVL
jgi:hypothetical protein